MSAAGILLEARIRIRTRADDADLLVVSSVAGGTNPYIADGGFPKGDGSSFDPMTNEQMAGSYTIEVVDVVTSGTDRVVTAKLEDVTALLQLGYLKVFVEVRRDGGSWVTRSVGYLVLLRLVDELRWELTVQDALRALAGAQLFNPSSTTTIDDFLALWPNRGCLFGGPVLGSFLSIRDLGGWTMRVRAGGGVAPSRTYWLEPVNVYGPAVGLAAWTPRGTLADLTLATINSALAKIVATGRPSFSTVALDTVADAMALRPWPGLVVLIDRGSGPESWRPLQPGYAGADDPAQEAADIVFASKHQSGVFVLKDAQTALTLGSIVKVRCLTVLPSEVSPVYIDRHPVDLLADLCAQIGIGFNASAGDDLKAVFGTGLRLSLRITQGITIGDLLRAAVFDLGIAVRIDASGDIVPFATRRLPNVVPTATIDDTQVAEGSVTVPFEQDVTEAGIQQFTFTHKVHLVLANAPDSVIEVDQQFLELNGDADPLLSGSLDVSVPGMLRTNPLSRDPIGQDWVAGEAQILFERFGRAAAAAEMDLIRGDGTTDADTAVLGQEVLVSLPQLPNRNKRLGDDNSVSARAMQIVQLTEDPESRPIRLLDSGPNAQPLTTKPTLSIAASSDAPRTIAELTITNAATLNGLGYGARIQIAVTTGGAPADEDYVDVGATKPGEIPTGGYRLPAVQAGSTVYARARSELAAHRPSDWQTGVDVGLTAIDDPTSVGATPVSGDGSLCDLAWTIGANAGEDLTDVWLRLDGESFDAAVKQKTLLAGSVQYRLEGLTPGTDYIASVQHRDLASGDESDPVDVSFTSDAGARTLAAPTSPVGFSGSINRNGEPVADGRYGLAVAAVEVPGFVEFAEAVEDAPGAGTYGAFQTIATQASIVGAFTLCARTAPNDGLRRQLKARHIAEGATSSSYTAVETVTPWTFSELPPYVPTLRVMVTPGPTSYQIDWSSRVGTVEVAIDGGSYGAPSASPITVTLDASAHTYDFRSTLGALSTIPNHVAIPALPVSVSAGFTSITPTATFVPSPADGGGDMTVDWTTVGLPGSVTFDVSITIDTGTYAGSVTTVSGASSGDTFHPPLDSGDTGHVTITVLLGGNAYGVVGYKDFTVP